MPQLFTYTTCRDCGTTLHTTDGDTVHPTCTPKPTHAERLAQEWLNAVENNDLTRENELYEQIEQLDQRPPRLLDAALTYASWGWPVFPLKPLSKVPATPHGFKNATTNPRHIQAWWAKHSHSNIGLPTGIAFDVIDIDVPDGPHSLAHILDTTVDTHTGRGLLPDAHAVCATASGGTHYYIQPKGGGNKASIMAGIDIRGTGGYVVAPPSTLGERGRSWSWVTAPSPLIKVAAVGA